LLVITPEIFSELLFSRIISFHLQLLPAFLLPRSVILHLALLKSHIAWMDLPSTVIQTALCDCSVLITIHHIAIFCVSSTHYQCRSYVYFEI